MGGQPLRPPRRVGGNRPKRDGFDCNRLLMNALALGAAFYAGICFALTAASDAECVGRAGGGPPTTVGSTVDDAKIEAIVEQRLRIELERSAKMTGNGNRREPRFPSKFASGIVATGKADFMSLYDYGLPDKHADGRDPKVMMLYSSRKSLPSDPVLADSAMYDNGSGIPFTSAESATSNCEVMNVVVVNERGSNQCVAIMDGYESYHLQRWMRIDERGKLDQRKPLVHVSRGHQTNGNDQFKPPDKMMRNKGMEMVRQFVNTRDAILRKLRPIVESVAKDRTVIVLVCNHGQSELLANFVCSANAKGLDISNVLVFSTDRETHSVATGLGMTSFYEEELFGHLPSGEAKRYGDRVFTAMMYAKVVTVQLVVSLDYDVLFQDVDVVWYKNPLEVFHDKNSPLADFDALFQDDGARSLRYAPWSANSGFYYIRCNHKTQQLFTSLLYGADSILRTQSHQQSLTALISEHSSLYGLKVKVLSGEDFPGGYHYHRDRSLMKDIVTNKKTPWLFHMSWTENKKNKVLFFKQMGLWHVAEHCEGDKAAGEIQRSGDSHSCCSVEPLVTCYYKDKPSIKPCNDSPPIDRNGRPFW